MPRNVIFLVMNMPKDGRMIFLVFTRENRLPGIEPAAVFLRISSVE